MTDVASIVTEHFHSAYETLASHIQGGASRRFGSVIAVTLGVQQPAFNRIFVPEPTQRADIDGAVEWMAARGVPYWVTAPEPVVAAVRGLIDEFELSAVDERQPGMVRRSLAEIPDDSAPVTVSEVVDGDDLDDFVGTMEAVFGISERINRMIKPPSLLARDDVRLYVGRVDGTPVACGTLVKTDNVAGLYDIAVVEDFRRRGIGEAVTAAMLRDGRAAGCDMAGLQSSEMAVPLYERMGFETVVKYHNFDSS